MSGRLNQRGERQWPEALELVIGAFRSGLNTELALSLLYDEAPQPLRRCLHRRAGSLWPQMPLERKISVLFSGPDLALVRSALLLSLTTGGRQTELLQTAVRLLRSRREFEERVKGFTAHARATAWIVGLSPLLLGGIFVLFAPELVQPLFSTEQGRWLLAAAAGLIGLGLWSVQKMSRIQP